MSQDPMGNQAGANRYAYCNNNPVNNRDPSGMIHDYELAMVNGGGGYSSSSSSSGTKGGSGGSTGGTGGGTTDTTDGTVDNTGGEGDLNNYMDYGGGGGMSIEEWMTWCREECMDSCKGDVDCYYECYGICVESQTWGGETVTAPPGARCKSTLKYWGINTVCNREATEYLYSLIGGGGWEVDASLSLGAIIGGLIYEPVGFVLGETEYLRTKVTDCHDRNQRLVIMQTWVSGQPFYKCIE